MNRPPSFFITQQGLDRWVGDVVHWFVLRRLPWSSDVVLRCLWRWCFPALMLVWLGMCLTIVSPGGLAAEGTLFAYRWFLRWMHLRRPEPDVSLSFIRWCASTARGRPIFIAFAPWPILLGAAVGSWWLCAISVVATVLLFVGIYSLTLFGGGRPRQRRLAKAWKRARTTLRSLVPSFPLPVPTLEPA